MNKSLPHNYNDLAPTIMEVHDIYVYLRELIALAETQEYNKFDVCEGLCELIQVRMTDNYHTIEPQYSIRIFKWLVGYWPETEEHLDTYLTVLVNLNIDTKVREFLEIKLNSDLSFNDKYLIKDALSEI